MRHYLDEGLTVTEKREPETVRRLASVPRVTIEWRPLAEYDRFAAGIS